MNFRALEAEITRLTLWAAALELIAFVALMITLYYVIRFAIRDGIRESGLIEHWRPRAATPSLKDTQPAPLPDMRADR
jgi:hypothetical protein